MHKLAIAVLVSIVTVAAPAAFAGAGHDHADGHAHATMSEAAAQEQAANKVAEFVSKGKIEESWRGAKPNKISQKTFSKGPEWVVEFVNEAAADPSKRTLYVFFDMNGHYLAANFTGN